jgi:uncharacterized protein YcnI
MKRIGTLIGTSALLLLIAGPAWAHVTVSPEEAAPDSFATLNFQVPHGCDGSATVSLSVQIPAGVVSVKPQVKPGWEITIEEGTLPEPVDYFGETLTEGVLSVTWTGGPLEDQYMDMFGMSVKLPNTEGPIFFPAIQTCEQVRPPGSRSRLRVRPKRTWRNPPPRWCSRSGPAGTPTRMRLLRPRTRLRQPRMRLRRPKTPQPIPW